MLRQYDPWWPRRCLVISTWGTLKRADPCWWGQQRASANTLVSKVLVYHREICFCSHWRSFFFCCLCCILGFYWGFSFSLVVSSWHRWISFSWCSATKRWVWSITLSVSHSWKKVMRAGGQGSSENSPSTHSSSSFWIWHSKKQN